MPFRLGLPLFFTAAILAIVCTDVSAQQEAPIYRGFRISLFDFSIKKQKPEIVTLKLSVVNTGRLPVSFGKTKKEKPSEQLVIELDTVNLPVVLQGRENLVTEAVRQEKINLGPGEALLDLSLDIKLETPPAWQSPPARDSATQPFCPDLIFDTAYISQYTDNAMSLRFVVRNIGEAAARLLGDSGAPEGNLAINVYFVSGMKLTRGAILADGIFIREGRETLDGVLFPGQALEGEMEISLDKRTRFSPNLLFELNPFQTVAECNRANNIRAVEVEF